MVENGGQPIIAPIFTVIRTSSSTEYFYRRWTGPVRPGALVEEAYSVKNVVEVKFLSDRRLRALNILKQDNYPISATSVRRAINITGVFKQILYLHYPTAPQPKHKRANAIYTFDTYKNERHTQITTLISKGGRRGPNKPSSPQVRPQLLLSPVVARTVVCDSCHRIRLDDVVQGDTSCSRTR
jgi:hypothetical protein